MRSSYIQDPIDWLDFHVAINSHCLRLQSTVCEGNYKPTSRTRILSEKSKGLCRQIVVPNIDDAIVLQALSDALYVVIKDKAPTNKSFYAPEGHRFTQAFKFAQGAPQYGNLRAWLDFQRSILQFSKAREYVIVTDIANYYDFIGYAHLRNTIARLGITSETALDMLIFTLAGMLWQPDYMPRVELGLPQMDLDAPRMLAHCFLYELDEFIEQKGQYDFARYMDDIDIGADSVADAKSILRDVDLVLQIRQVRLNSGKTRILTKHEAAAHFKIAENARIDALVRAVDRRRASAKSLRRERKYLAALYKRFVSAKAFDDGNGDKILKRTLKLSGTLGVSLPTAHLRSYLRDRPSVRSNLLDYITAKSLTHQALKTIDEFVRGPSVVDDTAYLECAYALNEAKVRANAAQETIARIVGEIEGKGHAALYGSLWLLSKFAEPHVLLSIVRARVDRWRGDETLGRLVGGLWPIMLAAGLLESFEKLILGARNPAAIETSGFHDRVATDRKAVASIRPYLRSTNNSKPLRISHPKFLLLLSVLQNPELSHNDKAEYLKIHKSAWEDTFYRRRVRSLGLSAALLKYT